MNWLKSAAGEFINELTSDIKEISQAPSKGDASPDRPSAANTDEHPDNVTSTQGPRPNINAAAANSAPVASRAAEKAASQPPAAVARPLTADEELFDWDDSDDEAEKQTAADPSSAPVQGTPVAATVADMDAGLADAAAPPEPQNSTDGWADDDLVFPDEETSPAAEVAAGVEEASVPAESPKHAVEVEVVQAAVKEEVAQTASHDEAMQKAAALEKRVSELERQLRDSKVEVTTTSEQLQTQTAEASNLRAQLEKETQRCAKASEEVVRLSSLVEELERRCEEEAQTAALNAANSQAEVISHLQEAKDRERALEAELRELRSAAAGSSGVASDMQQRLEERTAEALSLTERLEEESKHSAAAVAEVAALRKAAEERERLLEERAAELTALRTKLTTQERLAASMPESGGALAASATISKVLETFAQALAEAQGKVLTDRLQAIRGKTAAQLPSAQAAAPPAAQEEHAAPLPPAESAAAQTALDEDELGWGSDVDVTP